VVEPGVALLAVAAAAAAAMAVLPPVTLACAAAVGESAGDAIRNNCCMTVDGGEPIVPTPPGSPLLNTCRRICVEERTCANVDDASDPIAPMVLGERVG
jgi:hypothetical protein